VTTFLLSSVLGIIFGSVWANILTVSETCPTLT